MTEENVTRLLLICDDPARTDALRALLDSTYAMQTQPVSGEISAEPPLEFVLYVVPANDNGDPEGLGEWVRSHPDVDVLALIDGGSPAVGARAIAAGAVAWVPLSIGSDDLRSVIDRAAARSRQTARLTAEHHRYRDLLEGAPIGVFELRDGRVSYVNDHLPSALSMSATK